MKEKGGGVVDGGLSMTAAWRGEAKKHMMRTMIR